MSIFTVRCGNMLFFIVLLHIHNMGKIIVVVLYEFVVNVHSKTVVNLTFTYIIIIIHAVISGQIGHYRNV